jgi:flavorubredoxin
LVWHLSADWSIAEGSFCGTYTSFGWSVEAVDILCKNVAGSLALLRLTEFVNTGSPTLGGHMPTQVSAALGAILRMAEAKDKPCGAYGSFGWSGEAVDILDGRLRDAGCLMAFNRIKCQFRPDAKMLQVCFVRSLR